MKKLQDYINTYTGKGINWDGSYGNQCMDLYRHYVNWLGIPKQSMPVRGASDVWDTYLTEYFTRFVNTDTFVPSPGDIVIWKKTSALPFGHIAIFVSGDVNKFISFDQNWPQEGYTDKDGNFIGTGTPHLQAHTYAGVQGVLRIKQEVIPMANDEYGNMVYKSSQHDETVKAVFEGARDPRQTPSTDIVAVLNGHKSRATDLQRQLATAEAEVKNRIEQVSRLRDEYASKEKLYLDEQINLNKRVKLAEETTASLKLHVGKLEGLLDQAGREKGELNIKISLLESRVKELEAGARRLLIDEIIKAISNMLQLIKSKLGGDKK